LDFPGLAGFAATPHTRGELISPMRSSYNELVSRGATSKIKLDHGLLFNFSQNQANADPWQTVAGANDPFQ